MARDRGHQAPPCLSHRRQLSLGISGEGTIPEAIFKELSPHSANSFSKEERMATRCPLAPSRVPQNWPSADPESAIFVSILSGNLLNLRWHTRVGGWAPRPRPPQRRARLSLGRIGADPGLLRRDSGLPAASAGGARAAVAYSAKPVLPWYPRCRSGPTLGADTPRWGRRR